MPITHLTSTPVFQSGTGNRTVTPNVSTSVGDLMVLTVGFQDLSATTISAPTGWGVQKSAVLTGTLKTSLFTRTRQSGDSTWTYAPNQSVETSDIVLSVVGGDPASLIVGSDGTRAASGGAFVTTAPSITTTVAGSRVFIIATERTNAFETVEATVNNGFTKIIHAFANGTSVESIFIGYKDMPTAGAVGATTVTFQNSQASNGYAVLIAVAPASTAQDFAGVTAVVSGTSAALTARRPIAGSVVASSSTSAAFSVGGAVGGVAAGVSSSAATFTSSQGIAGIVEAISDAAATVTAAGSWSAAIPVASTASATLTVTTAPIPIGGTVAAHSGASATITLAQNIAGVISVESATTAGISAAFALAGVVIVETATSADLTVGGTVPVPPTPKVRTLVGVWTAVLTDVDHSHTLTGTPVRHTLEDA